EKVYEAPNKKITLNRNHCDSKNRFELKFIWRYFPMYLNIAFMAPINVIIITKKAVMFEINLFAFSINFMV
ncbi:MAG: hypothetical protein KDD45_17475, partial [Bdellovibrionales bacterium]|nr:hypothetical protein [Bdellovibrionales bacterium]